MQQVKGTDRNLVRKKLTISQLKRYLPLQQPRYSPTLPPTIVQYLHSPSFSNLSLSEQKSINQKFQIVYRNYYRIEDIIQHLEVLTQGKYTKGSIKRAICNSAERYGVVDWFKIVRKVMEKQNDEGKTNINLKGFEGQNLKNSLVNTIKRIFKEYKEKKVIWNTIEQVEQTKIGLQPKVLSQLIREVVYEVREHIEKNRIVSQSILYDYERNYQKINFIILESLINRDFKMYVQRKKCMYFYLYFDPINKGYFQSKKLLTELLVIKKHKPPKKIAFYITEPEQLLSQIRTEFNVIFETAGSLRTQFANLAQQYNLFQGRSASPEMQIPSNVFYTFISKNLHNRYSLYQSNLVLEKIKYYGNIHFLYNKPKPLQLESILKRFTMKNDSARKRLKKQNQVFYSFKEIIMNLVSRCKQDKITRERFTEIIVGVDPSLNYNAFYSVWRVYPGVINIKRMRQLSQLNPFACYVKLRKRNQDEYYKIYEDLIDQYPEGTTVMYEKVLEKINLNLQFMLENSRIVLDKYGRYDQVDYRKAIQEIFQPDFDVMVRKYIFLKVAEKAHAMWKARKKRIEAEKIIEGLKVMMIPSQSKKSLESKVSKKLSSSKSKASMMTKKSLQKINQETMEIVQWNVQKILDDFTPKQQYSNRQFHQEQAQRRHLCINHIQKYIYRTVIPRFSIHKLAGIVGLGQQLFFLKNNQIESIKTKFLYKPGIQIIDFTTNPNNDIIVLTSYFTLEFYSVSQNSLYSYKTIQVLDDIQCINNSMLEDICEERIYSKFPVLIKAISHNKMIINTTIANNKLLIINTDSQEKLNQVNLNQREHSFSSTTEMILKKIKVHPQCTKIVTSIMQQLNRSESISPKTLEQIFKQIGEEDDKVRESQRISQLRINELKEFVRDINKRQNNALTILILKEEFGLLKEKTIPESLHQVLEALGAEMKYENISIQDMLLTIDHQQQGVLNMKSLKDYLLKITQEVYLINQKQIDSYLKQMAVGKNVSYEAIYEIMMIIKWPYQIWERPYLITRDFIYEQFANLLIYTLEGYIDVFIKNVADNSIIGVLKGHSRVPQISYIPEGMLLITGDDTVIRIWRLYEDFINKYDQNPPWQLNPVYTLENVHDNTITSICYLSRAHCLMTTSLDSTAKFWRISYEQQGDCKKLMLKEQARIYSQEHYYLGIRSRLTNVGSSEEHKDPCFYEVIGISKVNKQINENNKYKFQFTIQLFHVEDIKLQTGMNNIHIEALPKKLVNEMNDFTRNVLGKKKQLLYQKWVKQEQVNVQKINLVTRGLERRLYEAVKQYYLFSNHHQLLKLANFLNKKSDKGFMIYKVLFDQYGLRVAERKSNMPTITHQKLQINQQMIETSSETISLPQEQLKAIMNHIQKIKKIPQSSQISLQELRIVVGDYLVGSQWEKFQALLNQYVKKNQKQRISIKIKQISQLFSAYPLHSEIDRLYVILRNMRVLFKNKHKKIWQLFVSNKKQLEKRTRIGSKEFSKKIIEEGVTEEEAKFIISFLAKNDEISFIQLIYFFKLADEALSIDLSVSNFSAIFLKNSKILKSRVQQPDESNQRVGFKQIEEGFAESKVRELESSNRQSGLIRESSRKSSSKKMRLSGKVSQNQSVSEKSEEKSQKSQEKFIRKKKSDVEAKHYPQISSSASRLSISHESLTKDSVAREANSIIKQIKERLKNQNKSLWDIVSLTIPDFMENSIITEAEYFSIYKALNSPIKLEEKIKLLKFVMRESEDYSNVHLNILFQLFETINLFGPRSKGPPFLPGQKYIISHIVGHLVENKMKLEHSVIQHFFKEEEEISIDNILQILQNQPFNLLGFCLREMELLLASQNKSGFVAQELFGLIMEKILKYNIKVQVQAVGYLDELIYRIDNRKQTLQELLPKKLTQEKNDKVNYQIFKLMISKIFNEKDAIIQNQYVKIILKHNQDESALRESPSKLRGSPTKKKGSKKTQKTINNMTHQQIIKNSDIKYKDLIKLISELINELKVSNDSEKDTLRKFVKNLEAKKINLFTFFKELDPNMNFYLNQIQFTAGLSQLKISDNFWSSITKKYPKRLYYYELINFLIQKGVVDYKCVDSELEVAMSKFFRRFMRNDDIEKVYERIREKDSSQSYDVTYSSFKQAFKFGNLFKEQELFYIFSAFVNADNLKQSKFSNDDIIKDKANVEKTFNFKMFTDTINLYRNQNITKTPLYKLCEWLKKRNISILNEFSKWMERNKKIKEIADALKNKDTSLSKEIFIVFIQELNSGLPEKQIKEMLAVYKEKVDFSVFNQKLQQIYKKGTMNIEAEEVNNLLQKIYSRMKQLKVSTQRLYKDFTQKSGIMSLNDFSNVVNFLEIGFTKIQIRQIFEGIDLEKKGYITLQQLQDSLEEAAETLEKQKQNIELENILEKLFNSKDKFSLKASRITFTLDRACIVFNKILTSEETQVLYNQAQQELKTSDLTEKSLQEYLRLRQSENRAKKDKKYKQLILKFLSFINRINLQVTETYHYFSKDTNNNLPKNKFLIIYQSLQLKSNIVEINALYSYLDQSKTGMISLNKWEDKLNMVQFENEKESEHISSAEEQIQVFYKVKLQLSEIYLVFIRKLFRHKQIYAYFDYNSNGKITHNQFLEGISNLGISLEQSMETRIINYLDKYKMGQISIEIIVKELQNCLSSKSKLILETKTSCIFKQKVHLIQEKQQYFLQRLVELEHFIEVKGKFVSTILKTQFMGMIRDFGIILGEDQANDIQRNFAINKQNLSLYPLYFMFVNIFKSAEFNFTPEQMERKRFQKLFEAMIRSNITVKIFNKIKTINEAANFLSQLKIFTPIETKLILEKISLPNTPLIDANQLTYQLRNSYLSQKGINNRLEFGLTFEKLPEQERLRRQIKALIIPSEVIGVMKATSGKISEQTFTKLLEKINLVFTRKQTHEYFQALSQNREYLLLQNLLSKSPEEDCFLDEAKEKGLIKKQFALDLHESEDQNQEEVYHQTLQLMFNHICKQIDFIGVSLQEAWQKYFDNFGYISYESFYLFLAEIGFDIQPQLYGKTVKRFLNEMEEQTCQKQIKRSEFENKMKTFNQYPNKKSKRNKYVIYSQILREILEHLHENNKVHQFFQKLERFIMEQTGRDQKLTADIFYKYIKNFYTQFKGRKLSPSENKYLKFIASSMMQAKQSQAKEMLTKLKNKFLFFDHLKTLRTQEQEDQEGQIIVNDPSARLLETKMALTGSVITNLELLKVCEHNFIFNYEYEIEKLYERVSSLTTPMNNLPRLAANLLCDQILSNPYLLEIIFNKSSIRLSQVPEQCKLPKQHASPKSLTLNSTFTSKSISLVSMNNIIIESQQLIPETNLYMINAKFYGYKINSQVRGSEMDKPFENISQATSLLQPGFQYFRAKNYYLWEPIKNIMPKMAINYRWKYIPNFIVNLAKQFQTLNESGFSIPHFKWQGLCQDKGIRQLGYANKIHHNGLYYEDITQRKLLNIQSPYSAPEIFINLESPQDKKLVVAEPTKFSHKIDVWIFGCLLYEFVWGHPPQSCIIQLFNYVKSRIGGMELAEALKMSQLPSDFDYYPFDFKKISEVLCLEHDLRAMRTQREDFITNIKYFGYRGLIKQLQIIYGSELMFYQEEIKLFEKIMNTIVQCMNPLHHERPQFNSIIRQYENLLEDQGDYRQFLNVLGAHREVSDAYKDLVEPLFTLFQSKEPMVDIKDLKQTIKKFESITKKCLNNKHINTKYAIPKWYPWPDQYSILGIDTVGNGPALENDSPLKALKKSGVMNKDEEHDAFPLQVLKHRQKIRTNLEYNIMSFLFNEHCFEILVNLCLKLPKEQPIKQVLFDKVIKMLISLLRSISNYESMLVGYIGQILEALVQLIFEQKFGFIGKAFEGKTPKLISDHLKPISLTQSKKQCINCLKNIIYVNGTGNIEYLPVKDFLDYQLDYRRMFEYFYAATNLGVETVHEQYLAINYFIDHIDVDDEVERELFWEILQYFRVPVIVLRMLIEAKDPELLKTILNFFYKLSDQAQKDIPIFVTQPLYTHLNQYLEIQNIYPDSLTIKASILEIIENLITATNYSNRILKLLLAPGCNTMGNILKLMIQPTKPCQGQVSPLYEQYLQLRSVLHGLILTFERNESYMREIGKLQGAEFIINSFKQKLKQDSQYF